MDYKITQSPKRKGIGSHTLPGKGATDSWITPKNIIDALGPFDLDPCSCDPQPWGCAKRCYTIADDGLSKTWYGRVWMNPPYSNCAAWLKRMAQHNEGTALIFARTETKMFFDFVWGKATAVLFLRGRLYFHHPDGTKAKGNAGGPSVLVAYGHLDSLLLAQSGLNGKFMSV